MSNLPEDLTSFVGRTRETAEVRRLLSTARLVTLTGVGGVGKTRLALRVATHVRRAFRDGVWLAELADLTNPALLPHTVAELLGVRDQAAQSDAAVLAAHLESRHLLLILDNGEHVLDECARLADTLLRGAPDVHILVTSRQALGIGGEHVFPVPPLSAPDPDEATGRPSLADYDAVTLFVDRARAVVPRFAVDDHNRETVVSLCRELDGIPLAIELAVARLAVLSPDDLLARLIDRFRLLTTGNRTAAPRQQTLRALVDWSHDLCTPHERLLWARLAVFSGSFTLAAVEDVCTDDRLPRHVVLDALSGLIDKSLLLRESAAGRTHYRMLETIRRYGADQLDARGERDTFAVRHLAWYRAFVGRAADDWFGPRQASWIAQLRPEHANIRAALDLSRSDPAHAAAGQEMAADLRTYWMAAGFLGEGRHWLEVLCDADPRPTPSCGRSHLVNGWLAILQGRTKEAVPPLRSAAAISTEVNDPVLQAYSTYLSGMAELFVDDIEPAGAWFARSVDLFRRIDESPGLLLSLLQAALVEAKLERPDRGSTLCEEALRISERAGEQWFRSYVLWVYGIVRWRQGDTASASALERESISIKRSFGERFGVALSIEVLAWTAATEEDHERAARLFGLLDRMWSTLGVSLAGFGHLIHFHDESAGRTRGALTADAYAHASRQGASLGFDEALAYALGEGDREVPSPEDDVVPLTRRERQVAGLVADGLSNKDIAAALVVSQRTAETHVQHILTKLEFTSRAQIATWYTRNSSR